MSESETRQGSFSPELRFKQYKLMVETAERNSDRRAGTHRFYTTVHTSLLTLLAIVGGYSLLTNGVGSEGGNALLGRAQAPIIYAVCILGIFLCILWRLHLNSFRRLNAAKFTVINTIERDLPYSAFQDEWKALSKNHVQLTTLERVVPVVALLLYLLLGLTYFALTQTFLPSLL